MKKKQKAASGQRRGFSLAEVAVALAVIVLISAATMSLVAMASKVDGQAAYTTGVNEYAESTLDCFRWADNSVDFEDAVDVLGFKPMEAPAEGGTDPAADSSNDHWYVLTGEGYRIEIRVNYITNPYEFEINAVDENGEKIYRFAYEK